MDYMDPPPARHSHWYATLIKILKYALRSLLECCYLGSVWTRVSEARVLAGGSYVSIHDLVDVSELYTPH